MAKAARGGKAPVHLIVGDKSGFDSFIAERAMDRVIDAALGESREDAVSVFHGDETSWGRLLESARTRSLFVSRRALVVRGAEGLKGDHRDLPDYLEDPSPDVTMVLLARKVDGRTQPWKLLSKSATVHKATAPRGRALETWIREELHERGLRLAPEGQQELQERVGQDLRRLSNELDKLEACGARERELDGREVASIIGRGFAPPFYVLGDAVASRETERCLELIGEMLDAGEYAAGLVATMYRSLRQLRMLKALDADRCPPDELVRLLGLPGNMAFKLRILRGAVRSWADAELQRALEALREADRQLKLGAPDARVVLTRAVVAALGREGKGAA